MYKRQLLFEAGTAFCAPKSVENANAGSVSYTHLDVYKRQMLHGRTTSVPVVDKESGRLEGIVSFWDVLEKLTGENR